MCVKKWGVSCVTRGLVIKRKEQSTLIAFIEFCAFMYVSAKYARARSFASVSVSTNYGQRVFVCVCVCSYLHTASKWNGFKIHTEQHNWSFVGWEWLLLLLLLFPFDLNSVLNQRTRSSTDWWHNTLSLKHTRSLLRLTNMIWCWFSFVRCSSCPIGNIA